MRGNILKNHYFRYIVIGFIILAIWQIGFIFNFLSGVVASVAVPFLRTEGYISQTITQSSAYIRSNKELLKTREELEERVRLLEAKLTIGGIALQENIELKELLGRRTDEHTSFLAAVLSKPDRTPYDTFILDIGERHGIQKGDIVTAYGDIVIGRIERVNNNTSIAKLFSAPAEELEVVIGKENIGTKAQGIGGGNFTIKLPHGVDIQEGDNITFPGLNIQVIGVVEMIQTTPSDSFQTILFKSPINIFELKWVEVILSSELQDIANEE